jgi:stalled ribosome alternative rescue factor ArfA
MRTGIAVFRAKEMQEESGKGSTRRGNRYLERGGFVA